LATTYAAKPCFNRHTITRKALLQLLTVNENTNIEASTGEQSNPTQQLPPVRHEHLQENATPVQVEQSTTDQQAPLTENIVHQNTTETKPMEVHHPHHLTHKKKWSEYLLEFFMLFLAVFLGFVAENIREDNIEHKRGHEYADRLLADLNRDTAWFNKENERMAKQLPTFDTLINLLIQPTPAPDALILSKLLDINYVTDAKLNTATYNQMKSSGSLRYINNAELTTAIQEYYEIQLPRAIESSQATRAFFNEYVKSFFIDHLRNQDMNGPTANPQNWQPVISGRNSQADQRLSNILSIDRTQLNIATMFYKSAIKEASELIKLIEKEY
jgi:hypothetical protein